MLCECYECASESGENRQTDTQRECAPTRRGEARRGEVCVSTSLLASPSPPPFSRFEIDQPNERHQLKDKEMFMWMMRFAYWLLANAPSLTWNMWAACFGLCLLAYVVPQLLMLTLSSPANANLKKRYNAKWAVVTGASSGIGRSLSERLAHYGVSVVLVAVPDEVLEKTHTELKAKYPKVQFRKVGVDLGTPGYLPKIDEATKDICPTLIFCNAGYVLTGFFWETKLEKQLANMECNAGSAVSITHHFVGKMIKSKAKGCVVLTSSAAAAMPSPFTCMYASTKAFLSAFGASLAAEVKSRGIDVCVVHPSPIASRFYDNTHKIDMLDFFKLFSVSPDTLPDVIFGSVGHTVWRDIGGVAIFFRLMMKVVDYNFMATLLANIAHTMPDYKRHAK